MKTKAKFWMRTACVALVVGSVSGFLIATEIDVKNTKALSLETDSTPIKREVGGVNLSYASMLEKATKSVVSVHTAELVREVRRGGQSIEDLFLRRFFVTKIDRNDS